MHKTMPLPELFLCETRVLKNPRILYCNIRYSQRQHFNFFFWFTLCYKDNRTSWPEHLATLPHSHFSSKLSVNHPGMFIKVNKQDFLTVKHTFYHVLIMYYLGNMFWLKHLYFLTNALNCIKLIRLKSTCINILKDNYKLRHFSDPLGSILREY